ncbi:MAG: flagellar biosynthetic protein FliO [Betaproteobacteria bacterium]
MHTLRNRLLTLAALTTAAPAQAAETAAAFSLAGMLQMLLGLAIVLALVLGMGWVMKRMSGHGLARGNALRVVAAAAVGQRERVVVVEIGGTWLVVGVAPGSVSALHSMARGELPPPAAPAPVHAARLADWLQRTLERKHAR